MLTTFAVRHLAAAATLLGALAASEAALAQDPCCTVSAIDIGSATVTARKREGGETFRFKVTNLAILRTLKVGQAVFADESFERVAFHPGGWSCCQLLEDDAAVSTATR